MMLSMATGVDAPDATSSSRAAPSAVPARRRRRWMLDVLAAAICLGLALVAQYTLPSLPGFDPFSWITWGHEIAHHVIGPREPIVLAGGPSWKPLPIFITTVFGFAGLHALPLWTIFVRAVAFYGLYLAYMCGSRLGTNERWSPSGPVAGVLSVVGVMIMADLLHYTFRVTSEPLTVTAILLWLDFHLRGRRLLALTAGLALSLMRPEASAFEVVYAAWLLWTLPGIRRRLLVLAEVAFIPVAWVVPPWAISGNANQASSVARDYTGNQGHNLYAVVLQRADSLLAWPVLVAAAIMLVIALRRRDWLPVVLGAVCIVWLLIFGAMTVKGYPGLTRFLLPPGALACVLAGSGIAQLASLAGGGLLSTGIASLLVAIAVPFCGGRITTYGNEHRLAETAVHSYDQMVVAVHHVGGRAKMLPCPSSALAINHTMKTGLAWALQVPLTRIDGLTYQPKSLHRPVLALLGKRNPVIGGEPLTVIDDLHEQTLYRTPIWRVARVTRPGDPRNACVGS